MNRVLLAILGLNVLIGGTLWWIKHEPTFSFPSFWSTETITTASVIVTNQTEETTLQATTTPEKPIVSVVPNPNYFSVTTGCYPSITDDCVRAYAAPATTSRERASLRQGSVLAIKTATTASDGTLWYEIEFNEYLRYGERVTLPWYVQASVGEVFYDEGIIELSSTTPTTSKRIIVDRSKQTLYAYENDTVVFEETVSTGLLMTPTPRGIFTIYRKTPTRYMQGPLPGISDKYFDLPGVPWNLYFSEQGAVIHGAYWHNSFGTQWSNGCVNLPVAVAKKIYQWADIGTTVLVRD